ncbi:hypothetical protein HMPREF9333_00065 [Johnsonella ignava ATCC 51276]|uniref:NfeD-like C-terminal domain-containing protein n=1 Tax=Johnsonella ignava ATCC 51276 TaxID=679200 RepID=G5GES7_9FIRM|nr:NfeD family protein [Johnsonella ignava]EHI56618.1 hypothetical protein HMPREF9333_00065 [Johnsonella ignava ATCC 51276]
MLWGILFAVFVLIEIIIPALVSVWFAAAALIMVFISPFITEPIYQMLIFSVMSLTFLLSFRNLCRSYMKPKDKLRQEEVTINRIVESEKDTCLYEVKYKGAIWSARGAEGYMPGDCAFIESFDGNKIILGKKV